MKKYIISIIIVLLLSTIALHLSNEKKEQTYPYIEVHVDTSKSTDVCASEIEYSIYGNGYFDIGFVGYKLEKKVLFGWEEVDIVSKAYTMQLVKYPFESNICTKNELESGKYRITTIMRESSTQDALSATFEIE